MKSFSSAIPPSRQSMFLFLFLVLQLSCEVKAKNWIDEETPISARQIKSNIIELADHTYDLVMSDEFNVPGRKFTDGHDPMWTALDKNDYTNAALHYYDSNYIYTDEGNLVIETEAKDTEIIGFDDVQLKHTHVTKHFRSGMLQSWNKFCFTGGIIEIEAVLPGKWDVAGLWPAFWLLGNLSRHTYVGSADGVWPWSLVECTDIAKKFTQAQHFSPCHETNHYEMPAGVGRGAPEVDIFEVQAGPVKPGQKAFKKMYVAQPFMSTSYQVAPGKWYNRPGPGWWPGPGQWYKGVQFGGATCININYYGNYNFFPFERTTKKNYWSDAISWNHQLQPSHFEQKYRYKLEWGVPPKDLVDSPGDGYTNGFINVYVNDEFILSIKNDNIHQVTTASVPSEPMYILLNTAISTNWGFECPPGCPCEYYDCKSDKFDHLCGFPRGFCAMMKEENPKYKINYVRVYQNKNDEKQKVGCSTPERPSRAYIEAHKHLYTTEGKPEPLEKIKVGEGKCNSEMPQSLNASDTCGGAQRGVCDQKKQKCECHEGWVGPNCLTKAGGNPIDWDPRPTLKDIGYYGPVTYSMYTFVAAFGVVLALITMAGKRTRKLESWKPIPQDERVV